MENQKQNFEDLGRQLSHPDGETGLRVADMMNQTNAGMIRATIASLELSDNSHVLELGHATCGFLGEILSAANNIKYSGLEISSTMSEFCQAEFANLIESGNADFKLYDGTLIPYPDNSFDFAFCVNTVYFWEDPAQMLGELLRVLKPGGKLAIGFAYKSFMGNLPFVNHLFRLYEPFELRELLTSGGFAIAQEISAIEEVEGKHGESISREYGVLIGQKS